MKKTILAWLLICLLLCGCGAAPEGTASVPTETTPPSAMEPTGFYDPDISSETEPGGAVHAYPLSIPYCQGFTTMGEGIVIFSDTETGTQLTLLTGDTLAPTAQRTLDTWLYDQTVSIQAGADGISYFNETTQETVILDEALREVTRIAAPEGLVGYPLLSADRQILYYCTESSICAMELETRLPRVLRQYTGAQLTLDGIHMDGSVLKCSRYDSGWQTFFLSAENGQLLEEREDWYDFESQEDRYITAFHRESFDHLLFGTGAQAPQALYIPGSTDERLLQEKSYGVLTITAETGIRMDYYDLAAGCLASTFTLEGDCFPTVVDGGSGILWLMVSDALGETYTLYRWDTTALPTGEDTVCTDAWYTRSNPDLNGIAQCQAIAWDMSQRYGVEILVWEDALAAEPWDYNLTEEYLVPVLKEQLARLDQQLSHFPEGFFETLSEDFSGLTVCLVRQLEGSAESSSVEHASGVQYWINDHAYIALSTVNASEGSFYHELCHVMDTRIIAESNAYDQWEELNPSGFAYDYDYIANASRNAGEYLRDAERCFIDTYSMSFPKEDRARILEYAMTEGNEHYFQSKTMQSKLKQICIGIREAFGLKKSPDTFLWEQYLNESLAYSK